MDHREIFEVQAQFALDILEHNLRLLAVCEGQPRFPRFVRKTRAQLEQLLVMINTFEEAILEENDRENDEMLADSATSLTINCYSEEDATEENKEWTRSAWIEHQTLIEELGVAEEKFFQSTKLRCKVMRIKARIILNRLQIFEAKAERPSPLT